MHTEANKHHILTFTSMLLPLMSSKHTQHTCKQTAICTALKHWSLWILLYYYMNRYNIKHLLWLLLVFPPSGSATEEHITMGANPVYEMRAGGHSRPEDNVDYEIVRWLYVGPNILCAEEIAYNCDLHFCFMDRNYYWRDSRNSSL